ncbi:XRE family transcriptional regulator [Streptomyces sp. NPDC127074]|uniref:XRE family transcriptional regulator n=1 Tax=Streptomyces sp. NPDC127074 TaxID=3347130 RepID=UPI00365775CA
MSDKDQSGAENQTGTPQTDVITSELGQRIRSARKRRRISLAAFAEATGYSVGFLSQIETGAALPSLSALAAIASTTATDVRDLLDITPGASLTLTRSSDAPVLTLGSASGSRFRLFSARGTRATFSAMIEEAPQAALSETFQFQGERFVLMLDGTLTITLPASGGTCHLQAGDALHYRAATPHQRSVDDQDGAVMFWLTYPAII